MQEQADSNFIDVKIKFSTIYKLISFAILSITHHLNTLKQFANDAVKRNNLIKQNTVRSRYKINNEAYWNKRLRLNLSLPVVADYILFFLVVVYIFAAASDTLDSWYDNFLHSIISILGETGL